jgi:hypothetical protein
VVSNKLPPLAFKDTITARVRVDSAPPTIPWTIEHSTPRITELLTAVSHAGIGRFLYPMLNVWESLSSPDGWPATYLTIGGAFLADY